MVNQIKPKHHKWLIEINMIKTIIGPYEHGVLTDRLCSVWVLVRFPPFTLLAHLVQLTNGSMSTFSLNLSHMSYTRALFGISGTISHDEQLSVSCLDQ